MTFYVSLSGLKGAQADLSAISNNVANVNSTAFKKSKAQFGDIFAAAPMQTTHQVAGQGVRVQGISQQFTQGTIETTDKTLDMAITGEGFFTVKAEDGTISYTRNGAFSVDDDRYALDTTGARMQVFPVDPDTGVPTTTPTAASTPADLVDLQVPTTYQGLPDGAQLTSVGVAKDGLVSAIYADGSTVYLGQVAMASFNSLEGLRQQGDAHWSSTVASGSPILGLANEGMFGAVNTGSLERSNVDITDELVSLIAAQRNFQANSKAIEAANTLTTTIVNIRT
ncbi:MAG: flagellar hook-basal body complex protein [Sphingobium sp.]|jgi:flagellar hook protein FlgE|uniref:Flagellar hook protein FlgE n=1 Tax=Sphingobium xenophagum TaxID=121428 RepID=A0A249MR15_SPHXE|nr:MULTISPECIES: flagellar hook-basal body complex protein [Sphingobium]MBU0659770.1 flagellar hook-basal body complex protein [Alphaproteobacteria bacterium]ASY43577.1 flagellar biosynthesis protein FlgG [Sphingobium xenophagum]MBA4753388.1 flagellar hook-basal body complex protein [Sphingobium sp.]MBG6117798.1 flagellar hook protein FlgE [Sphingobium sp. JAI105]MBS88775.1 flagellar biosynthesis protein FlgG [Sphingobium sp.]|tara:strand:+ start:3641 stop:4486 length:846 start_codon:yes stop_codon:yes gene_type:complete